MVRHGFGPGNSTCRIETVCSVPGCTCATFQVTCLQPSYVPTGTHSHLKFESSGMWRCVIEHIVFEVSEDGRAFIFRISNENEDSTILRNVWNHSPSDADHIPEDLNLQEGLCENLGCYTRSYLQLCAEWSW
jgi:hypothetical protein